jgi:type II secretory pathway component PulC
MKTRLGLLFLFVVLAAVIGSSWLILSPPENNSPLARQALYVVSSDSANTSAAADAVQKTELIPPQIVLHGTFVNGQTQQALISLDDQTQRWFNLKDYFNVDFYLAEVFNDHIMVRDRGNTMALEIRIKEGGATQELPEIMPAIPAHAWVDSLPTIPGIERVETNHYRIKRELVMKELQSGEIFKQVLIVPQNEGGFFINRIKEGSMAEAIGLRVGDTIHKINDKPLTNITDVLDLYKNLDSLEKVNVEINRMHQVQNLNYELN